MITTFDQFGDIYGLDDEVDYFFVPFVFVDLRLHPTFPEQLLSAIPQPVKAVILLFPCTDDFKKDRDARYDQKLKKLGEGHVDPTIMWIKQTVRSEFILSPSLHGNKTDTDGFSFVRVDWKRMRNHGNATCSTKRDRFHQMETSEILSR